MATATVRPAAAGAFTFDDLDNAPDDGLRRELVDGSLVVSPSPVGRHQLTTQRVTRLLEDAASAATVVIQEPYDWRVAETVESFEPDVLVFRAEDFDPDGYLWATPLLCVEVLSPSHPTLDTVTKRGRYESLDVPAYWIVDPLGPSVTELRLRAGRYDEAQTVADGDEFATDWPFPVRLAPADLVRTG
jgi:Uma2 family endonuclease